MHKNLKSNILDNIIYKIFLVMVALTPLFFLPITTEFYDLNKQALLLALTIVLLGIWIAKIVTAKSITIVRSTLDIPLLAFMVVAIFSSVFSISVSDSVFGSTGRWFPSLIGIGIVGIIYYAVAWSKVTVNQTRYIIMAFIASVSINSLISIISYFQIYFGSAPFLQSPNFNLTGSTNTSVILSVLAFTMAIGLHFYSKNQKAKVWLLILSIVNLFSIAILNTFVGWVLLIVSIISLSIILHTQVLKSNKVYFIGLISLALLLATLKNVPQISNVLTNQNFPYEITLPIEYTWSIVTGVIEQKPVIGSGPSTFYLNYTINRPEVLNSTELWNIRFDKPFNEALNILIEFGLLGFFIALAIVYAVVRIIKSSVLNSEDQEISRILSVVVLTSLSIFVLTYATVLTSFVAVIFLGLLVNSLASQKSAVKNVYIQELKLSKGVISSEDNQNTKESIKSPIKLAFILPIIALMVGSLYLFSRSYLAEYYTRMSIYAARQNNWQKVYELQEKAIQASPTKDELYNRHAQTILVLANSIAAQQDLTDEDRQAIINLVAQAVRVSRFSTENVNSLNVRNWETQALIFRNIFQAVEDADDWAIASYNIAIQLDPTNPRLRLELGGIYYASQDYLSAASQFRQAISLKADYANAYYNFAQALYLLGDYNNAKASLETTLALVPQDSDDYNVVLSEIEILDQQIQENQETQQEDVDKPTIQQLEASQGAETTQEPITNIGESQPQITTDITEDVLIDNQEVQIEQ